MVSKLGVLVALRSELVLFTLSAALAVALFFLDISLPAGVAGGVPYIVLVLVGYWLPRRSDVFLLATVATVLAAVGSSWSLRHGVIEVELTNRGLALLAIWITTILLALAKGASATPPNLSDDADPPLEAPGGRPPDSNQRSMLEMARLERAAGALKLSERRAQAFAELSTDWLFETDADFRFTFLSCRDPMVVGGSPKEVLGKTTWDLAGVDPESDEHWRRHRATLLAHQPFDGLEIRQQSEDGSRRYSLWSGRPVFDAAGRFIGYRGVGRDVSQEREREFRLAEIIRTTADGFAVVDEDGVIESVNLAAEQLFQYEAVELKGENVKILLPDLAVSLRRSRAAGTRQPVPPRVERTDVIGQRKDGTTFAIDLVIGQWTAGGQKKFLWMQHDLRGAKMVVNAGQHRQPAMLWAKNFDALRALSGGIAHDFNNSLFPIIGLTELTRTNLPVGSADHERLEKVLAAAYHARDLAGQILAFSRQDPPDRRTVELRPVIRDALEFLRTGLPENVGLREAITSDPCLALADPTQIRQVVINLGTNARDAMAKEGGTLTVRLSTVDVGAAPEVQRGELRPGPQIRLDVTDTGHGMSEKMAVRAFEPFFTTKEIGRGTGLGLALVDGIVRSHEGAISVLSEQHRGSTFSVFIPAIGATREHTSLS